MTRREMMESLYEELEKLKDKDVERLMKERRVEELDNIKVDFSSLNEYLKTNHLDLKKSEIKEECVYELVFYAHYSQRTDNELFENWFDLRTILANKGEALSIRQANRLGSHELREGRISDWI